VGEVLGGQTRACVACKSALVISGREIDDRTND